MISFHKAFFFACCNYSAIKAHYVRFLILRVISFLALMSSRQSNLHSLPLTPCKLIESVGYAAACIKLLLMFSTCGKGRGTVPDLYIDVYNIMCSLLWNGPYYSLMSSSCQIAMTLLQSFLFDVLPTFDIVAHSLLLKTHFLFKPSLFMALILPFQLHLLFQSPTQCDCNVCRCMKPALNHLAQVPLTM